MDIIAQLPSAVNNKIFMFLSHPVADLLHKVIVDAENYFGYEGQETYPAMKILNYTIYDTEEYINEAMMNATPRSIRRW